MNFDRIIIVTNAPPNTGLPWFYYLALKDIYNEERVSICFEEGRKYDSGIVSRGTRKLKNELGVNSKIKRKQIEEELIDGNNFVLIFNTAELKAQDIIALSNKPNVKIGAYYSDHPLALIPAHKKVMLETTSVYDVIFTFSPSISPILYRLNVNKVAVIPFGYCKYTHLPAVVEQVNTESSVITYFGTWTTEIENWLIPLTNHNLRIEGNLWENATNSDIQKRIDNKPAQLNEGMIREAGKSRAVVNFTRAPHGCFHTMKTFELAIAKAAICTNYSPEQESFFKDKESLLYFNTKTELSTNVDLLSKNDDLNMELRSKAYEMALPHNYHNRAEMLINELKQL